MTTPGTTRTLTLAVDAATWRVTVSAEAPVSAERVRDAVEEAGYALVS